MRTRSKKLLLVASVLVMVFPTIACAQSKQMQLVPVEQLKWVPCDPNATQPTNCQLAYFRGDPAKEPNAKMLKAASGFVFPPHWHTSDEHIVMTQGTITIAAEGQEKETLLKAGDYLYLPGRQVHWGSCPAACMFYLFVDGPDSYIDVNSQRP